MQLILRIAITVFVAHFLSGSNGLRAQQPSLHVLSVPGSHDYCKIDTAGKSVLPSGRYLTPAGRFVRITNDPFGMAISPDGKKAVTLHNGVFTIINLDALTTIRVPGYNNKLNSPLAHDPLTAAPFADSVKEPVIPTALAQGSFLGIAFATDSKTVYLSGGDDGAVICYDIDKMQKTDSISLNGKIGLDDFEDSFTSDLLLNQDKNELLILDRANFRLVRYDLSNRRITASIPAGRQPFGLALSNDKKTAFVANVGAYSYPLVKGLTPANAGSMMISHHPYGDNTKEAIVGTVVEGKTIPGVGSPLSPEAMSVFSIDLVTNKVIDKFRTGYQVGQMIEGTEVVGGASPNSVAAGKQYVYVTNATNDNISVIDYNNHRITANIQITVDKRIDKYRGLLPFGIALSGDEKTLYVSLLGFNAVAVIDVATRTTKGLIPTGWGPTRVRLSADEKSLYIISCRGLGAGPNGGADFIAPPQGTYIGDIQLGSFQKLSVPSDSQLAVYTRQVLCQYFYRHNGE